MDYRNGTGSLRVTSKSKNPPLVTSERYRSHSSAERGDVKVSKKHTSANSEPLSNGLNSKVEEKKDHKGKFSRHSISRGSNLKGKYRERDEGEKKRSKDVVFLTGRRDKGGKKSYTPIESLFKGVKERKEGANEKEKEAKEAAKDKGKDEEDSDLEGEEGRVRVVWRKNNDNNKEEREEREKREKENEKIRERQRDREKGKDQHYNKKERNKSKERERKKETERRNKRHSTGEVETNEKDDIGDCLGPMRQEIFKSRSDSDSALVQKLQNEIKELKRKNKKLKSSCNLERAIAERVPAFCCLPFSNHCLCV